MKTFIFTLFITIYLSISCETNSIKNRKHPILATDQDISNIIPEISNWKKWGDKDEKGTVNYITPNTIVAASKLIKNGKSISLARQTSITETNGVREGTYKMQKGDYGCRDYVGAVWHGFAVTHLDGLCHVFADTTQMYNGFSTEYLTDSGAKKLGLENLAAEGITGRGVLIDVAEYFKGKLELGQPIMPSDLDQVLLQQNTYIQTGDILFIRTGFGSSNSREKRTGLHPSCLLWIHEKKIALLGSDGDNDAHPINFKRWLSPFHTIGIPYLGLPLIDNADLEQLGKICKLENRYEFFITINPWRIEGTTSCPINPMAIF